jgi:agmatinase
MPPNEFEDVEKGAAAIRRLLPIPGNIPSFMDAPIATGKEQLENADIVILGFPWEGLLEEKHLGLLRHQASVPAEAYANPRACDFVFGADRAPGAIRRGSWNYTIHPIRTQNDDIRPGFCIPDHVSIVDYCDVDVVRGDAEATFANAEAKLAHILEAGAVPIVFGGDHSISYPVLRVISEHTKGNIGIIHFDCHYDLDRVYKYDAAWQFIGAFEMDNIRPENMAQVGISTCNEKSWYENARELGVTSFTISDIEDQGIEAVMKRAIDVAADGTKAIYVSLDVDVIDPAFCPAQKYPEPGGMTSREILKALRMIGEHGIAGFDMACLSPLYDDPNGLGAQLAARCAVTVIGMIALKKSMGEIE